MQEKDKKHSFVIFVLLFKLFLCYNCYNYINCLNNILLYLKGECGLLINVHFKSNKNALMLYFYFLLNTFLQYDDVRST